SGKAILADTHNSAGFVWRTKTDTYLSEAQYTTIPAFVMPLYEAMIQIYKETRSVMSKKRERNQAIYEYLKQCWDEAGDVPTHREIAQACNISLATVSDGLSMLEAQGRIT